MSFRVYIKKNALKTLKELPHPVASRILSAIKLLESFPKKGDIRPLKGAKEEVWRLRVGQWRVLFYVRFDTKEIFIFRIRKRESAYRGF